MANISRMYRSKKEQIEYLLKSNKGISLEKIATEIDAARMTVYNEVKRNISDEDFSRRNYAAYSAAEAIENDKRRYEQYVREGRRTKWSQVDREQLEAIVKTNPKITMTQIGKIMKRSEVSISHELRSNLSAEDFLNKNYGAYSAEESIRRAVDRFSKEHIEL